MAILVTHPVKYTLYPNLPNLSNNGVTSFFSSISSLLPFNCEQTASYTFKAEDVLVDRVPTIRRVIITYIDKGGASVAPFTSTQFTVTINATDDTGALVTQSKLVSIGSASGPFGTNLLTTVFVDIVITGFRPQLTISRATSAGGLYIVSVLMVGNIENQVL